MGLRADLVVGEGCSFWDDDQLVIVVVEAMDDGDAAPGKGSEWDVDAPG